jgi:hypothetical protein
LFVAVEASITTTGLEGFGLFDFLAIDSGAFCREEVEAFWPAVPSIAGRMVSVGCTTRGPIVDVSTFPYLNCSWRRVIMVMTAISESKYQLEGSSTL